MTQIVINQLMPVVIVGVQCALSKIRKNISISEEAAEKLNQQSNASQYIEDLILGKIEREAPWKDLEYRIDELKKLIESSSKPKATLAAPKVEEPMPTGRSKSAIKQEIDELEAERADKLEFMQDPDEGQRIHRDYQSHIDALWAEYHAS